MITGAVVLVDDDGEGDAIHDDVLEQHVGGGERRRAGPCLDPDAVGGAGEITVGDVNVAHRLLVLVLAQAPDANAVAGAAPDAVDGDVGVAVAEGDAIVPDADD